MNWLNGITARWRIEHPWPNGAPATRVVPVSQKVPPTVIGYLLPSESKVITIRRHPGQLAGHVGVLVCACTAASLITAVTNSSPLLLGAAWGTCAAILLYLIARGFQWLFSYIVVTDTRLMLVSGPFNRKVTMVPVRKIQSLKLHRSWLGWLIGYGELTLRPARHGYRMPKVNYLPYPEQIYLEVAHLLLPGEDDN